MKKDNPTKNQSSDCSVTINIETSGSINIYNCSKVPEDKDCGCKDNTEQDCKPDGAVGACVPASLGAKPKQSRETKLERLLKNNPVPSALGASFIHTCKRFDAGKTAGNELESKMFEKFRGMSPQMKNILKCTAQSFNSLSAKHKRLFAGGLMQDINTPVNADSLAQAFGQEITGLISGLALENHEAPLEERPGRMRLFEIPVGEEVFESQVRIFKINGLRTYDNIPRLRQQDLLPEEFQQTCTPRLNGDMVEWDCEMQEPPCDGAQLDNTCLRVQQIQNGTSVTLEGVNFFDINAKVQLRIKQSADNYAEADAFVYGDIQTPLTEIINGTERNIADSRVHDKIFFTIPQNTPPGIYEFMVVVPNTTGLSGFGDKIVSNIQYLEIIPPSTARFQISSERLWARKETAPQSWGSDEVGIKINAIPFFADLNIGEMQQHSFRFGDVDSGDTRQMESVLFSHTQPILGVILSVIGYEIDGEEAYKDQITEWTDVFYDLLKEQWKYIFANSAIAREIFTRLTNLGFWGYVIIAVAIAITLVVDLFIALWAPADLIIQDTLGFSVTDLARMTNINIPAPEADSDKTIYTTADDIDVRLMLTAKIQNQYTEERGYLSDDEDSWYNIKFRYNRIA